jgi:hypothetical protein
VPFDGSASDLSGSDLPQGVSPDDEIAVALDDTAILKQETFRNGGACDAGLRLRKRTSPGMDRE